MKRTCLVVALCLRLSGASAGIYSGGSGTAADPYRIGTVDDWRELIPASDDRDKHFILIADFDLGGISDPMITSFSGVLDGQGHVLRNAILTPPSPYFAGLFQMIVSPGQIRNLGIENIQFTEGRKLLAVCVG